MKFNLQGLTLEEVISILEINLNKLNFIDNFEGFETDIVIQPNSTITVRNNLTFVPSRYIILSQEGNGLITKTGTWTRNSLYLKNNGTEEVNLKVMFLK